MTWRAAALGLVLLLALGACGDDDGDDDGGGSVDDGGEEATGSVAEVCGSVAALGNVILGIQDASSAEEIEAAVTPALADFVAQADAQGDAELVELAATAQESYTTYLTATDPIDSREAGNAADIALDRAVARCLELGATNEFPQEP